jgi:general secretion pathway protein J
VSGGFTLLEVLVVLVIVSLLMTVLTQALWMGLDMLRRARTDMSAQASELVRLSWYRDTVAGLQPEELNGPHPFSGTARRFSGLTSGAPVGNLGAMLPVTVELNFDARAERTLLQMKTAASDKELTLLSWPGRVGEFVYVDGAGREYDQWPPQQAGEEQLPRVVMLKARPEQAGPLLVYTAILGDRRTPVALEQTLGGIGAKP